MLTLMSDSISGLIMTEAFLVPNIHSALHFRQPLLSHYKALFSHICDMRPHLILPKQSTNWELNIQIYELRAILIQTTTAYISLYFFLSFWKITSHHVVQICQNCLQTCDSAASTSWVLRLGMCHQLTASYWVKGVWPHSSPSSL